MHESVTTEYTEVMFWVHINIFIYDTWNMARGNMMHVFETPSRESLRLSEFN